MDFFSQKITQNGKEFYLVVMPAKVLCNENFVKVDIWSKSHDTGYQRSPIDSRSKQFSAYIEKAKGFSPNSILLSCREKIKFTPISVKGTATEVGILSIPSKSILWAIDGQHRKNGLGFLIEKDPMYENFEVPVIIFPVTESYEEAKQFVIINKTQKGVKSDLAERFLVELSKREKLPILNDLPKAVTRGIDWKPKAIEIADKLNMTPGVWYKKINLPNEPRLDTTVSQKSFTDSLEPILDGNSLFSSYTTDEIALMINRYWEAIKNKIDITFTLPKDYVVQRTTGVFVLNKLFPIVASYCTNRNGKSEFTVENIQSILDNLTTTLTPEYWANGGQAGLAGTSKKSFGMLFNQMKDELDDAMINFEGEKIRPFKL